MIYLDNAATTRPLPCAINAMNSVLQVPANPNSSHSAGQAAREILEQSKEKMLRLLGASKGDQIIFTSGASEAAALAIKSMEDNCTVVGLNNIDHHCVTEYPLAPMKGEKPYPYGLAYMKFQNEVGSILPDPDLPKDALWACDITAGVGHVPFAFKDYPRMTYAFGDAMKFGGIPGCGFLLAKHGAPISQMIFGAPNRGGTPPVALIAAMAAALEWHTEHMDENRSHLLTLLNRMIDDMLSISNSTINTPIQAYEAPLLPHILNVSFDGVDGKALALMCSKRGVMISAGAACTSGDNAPSHVLMAMFHDEARARSAVRISFSHENTVEEAEQAAKIIAECVEQLRAIS